MLKRKKPCSLICWLFTHHHAPLRSFLLPIPPRIGQLYRREVSLWSERDKPFGGILILRTHNGGGIVPKLTRIRVCLVYVVFHLSFCFVFLARFLTKSKQKAILHRLCFYSETKHVLSSVRSSHIATPHCATCCSQRPPRIDQLHRHGVLVLMSGGDWLFGGRAKVH